MRTHILASLLVSAALALNAVAQATAPARRDPNLPPAGGWVTQFAHIDIIATLDDLNLSTMGDRSWGGSQRPEAIKEARLQIRTPDNKRCVADIDMTGRPSEGLFSYISGRTVPSDILDKTPSLPGGDYLVAWVVNGRRRSNVYRITLEPRKDVAREARVRLVQIEGSPERAREAWDFAVYVTRGTETDPAPDNMTVAAGILGSVSKHLNLPITLHDRHGGWQVETTRTHG